MYGVLILCPVLCLPVDSLHRPFIIGLHCKDANDSIQALRLLPSEEAPEGAKVRLVYGAIGTDYGIQEKIAQFNRGNKEYYIEYRDYSEGMMGGPSLLQQGKAPHGAGFLQLHIRPGQQPQWKLLPGDNTLSGLPGRAGPVVRRYRRRALPRHSRRERPSGPA